LAQKTAEAISIALIIPGGIKAFRNQNKSTTKCLNWLMMRTASVEPSRAWENGGERIKTIKAGTSENL